VHNIRDILNKQLTGSKMINHISTVGDLAYFACDFGVVVLDLKTLLVKDTWFTISDNKTYAAYCVTVHEQRYYLATDQGIFSLPLKDSNPADFSQWTQENGLSKSNFKLLCSYQDRLFAVNRQDSLFVLEDQCWSFDSTMRMHYFRSFEVNDDKLLVCDWNHVKIFSGKSLLQYYYWQPAKPNSWQNGYEAIFDEKMNIWVADYSSGLVHINAQTKECEIITASGPANSNAYGLCLTNGILAVVPGSRSYPIVPMWTSAALSIMKDDNWQTYTDAHFSPSYYYPRAFNSVAINPLNTDEIYIASWLSGLFKLNTATNEMTHYHKENSPLQPASFRNNEILLSGLSIDKQNYLWMAQSEVSQQIKVKNLNTQEEEWYSFSLSALIDKKDNEVMIEDILIDSRNYKWVPITRQNQLIVLRGPLNNIEKRAVDIKTQVSVEGNRITCIAEDRDGNIWTGCDQGVKVIYDAGLVFDKKIYAKNILIQQIIGDTSYARPLLEFEHITCITVDAANRKWIGTRSAGVFLISPNGTQEILHFTTDNSPLFSNQINDIKINPENGEVFIATERGLISYKGTATTGKENYSEAIVYPNPVRENYSGPIAVKGLMEDSFCKITDATGNLVWQGVAYGGQLIWNGKDFYGNRPSTGVYFVMASSKTGKEKKVAKFLFIQ